MGALCETAELERFIVAAKAAAYVGGGAIAASSRDGSHDFVFAQGVWSYRDSYFGGSDFLGQEVVWHRGTPAWAMNYYGCILRPELIDASRAGATIKSALAALYAEGRFLGGFDWEGAFGSYCDRSTGDAVRFSGIETISVSNAMAYRLDYCGGLIRP